jgi:hypothetical protein
MAKLLPYLPRGAFQVAISFRSAVVYMGLARRYLQVPYIWNTISRLPRHRMKLLVPRLMSFNPVPGLVAFLRSTFSSLPVLQSHTSHMSPMNNLLIYERENKPCFSLELSHIQFINYSLHIVDIFHISCHDISIVIAYLVTHTTHIYSNTMGRALLLIIGCVYRHLTVF